MKRAALLLSGIAAGGIVFCLLCTYLAAQCVALYTALPPQQPQRQYLQLPCEVKGTSLKALQLASYEGPFWEDDSADEVVQVAALVVENTADVLLTEGAVVLEAEGQTMVFELFYLPPGQRVLVLERDRKRYCRASQFQCSGWQKLESSDQPSSAKVEPSGKGALTFLNQTDQLLSGVTAVYKHYDPDSGMYIGGIAYAQTVSQLCPGESRTVMSWRYSSGYSRVVQVIPEP